MQHIVIARAFSGEPLKRVVIEAGDTHVWIANPNSLSRIASGETSPVGFPRTDIFVFDDATYQLLTVEWKASGQTKFETWSALTVWRG